MEKENINSTSLRDKWTAKVTAAHTYVKRQFDNEAKKYIEAYRHEFAGTIPNRLLTSDRVDINVVYQTIKTLLPVLYFKNPKVFIKSLQEKIYKIITAEEPVAEENGEIEYEEMPIIGDSGQPLRQEFDGPRSALILQSAINQNIAKADLKQETKAAIEDALLTFYGAIKCGWGNDQGVASMGEGAPPSIREDVYDDAAYGIRLPPWDVVVDPVDFYHPTWIAIRYLVAPEQLKNDPRIQHGDKIKGTAKLDDRKMERMFADNPNKDVRMAEYYEVFVKPCAEYPEGKYFLLSEEVKDGFLYEGSWPLKAKTFPVKLLYFNRDPEGGLPVPDARYFIGHQKAKLNLRNTEYEYIQRTLPMLYLNEGGMVDAERIKKQIQSGAFPRVITGNRPANQAIGSASFPDLPVGFHTLDAKIDNDIARVVGLLGPVTPSTNTDQLATGLKIAASSEQVRQQERADCVADFMQDILEHWVDLYKEFAGPENYALIDGETFPVKWGRDEIQGNFDLEVKPFSMSYEDPVIRRRQWVDLLNLTANPAVQGALQAQGFEVDFGKIWKRVLETYDERDVETFVHSMQANPEMQVMDALRENEALAQGDFQAAAVLPEDNHKLHILIHGLVGPEISGQHILQHQQAMMGIQQGGSPGGGNPEGMPLNGVAADQEMMMEPLQPSATNQKAAIQREASNPTDTR